MRIWSITNDGRAESNRKKMSILKEMKHLKIFFIEGNNMNSTRVKWKTTYSTRIHHTYATNKCQSMLTQAEDVNTLSIVQTYHAEQGTNEDALSLPTSNRTNWLKHWQRHRNLYSEWISHRPNTMHMSLVYNNLLLSSRFDFWMNLFRFPDGSSLLGLVICF